MDLFKNFQSFDESLPRLKKKHLQNVELRQPMFEIEALDSLARKGPCQQQPRQLCNFEVVWIKTGSGNVQLDLASFQIDGSTLYWLSPGQLHLMNFEGTYEGYRISFSSEFLQISAGQYNLPFLKYHQDSSGQTCLIKVAPDIEAEIEVVIRAMMHEYANNFQYRSEILKGLLKIFVAYFSRRFQIQPVHDNAGTDNELFSRFIVSLEKNYLIKKNVADYAEEFAVTPNYFSEIIKKVSGFTASYHIQQRIVMEAKRLLVCTGATMKEIAFHLGFSDAAHFSKFYKNVTGKNFTEYRSMYIGSGLTI